MKADPIKAKANLVENLSTLFKDYDSFLIFEYLSLKSEEINLLRREFYERDAKLLIQKNNIINRVLKSLKYYSEPNFKGPNAILLTKSDIVPIQKICSLKAQNKRIKLKAAFFDNSLIEDEKLKLLSSLKSKNDFLISFSQTILSPLYKFLFLVKEIANSKQ